ncbi:MAG: polyphosphate polymerase domain-containing protein [Clostridia bacterium]|nr:polyphosphate polymerase domain-containing protein [Clostridia bacterium]
MAYQSVFKRIELKYLITAEQKERLMRAIGAHLREDAYGETVIRNLYFDTPDYRLIRRSVEKPPYKEKLRMRSYGRAEKKDVVFLEIKKKYKSVVYKRRMSMTEESAIAWIEKREPSAPLTQIAKELAYFRDFYASLRPMAFISYKRQAYYAKDDRELRVTFDEDIRYRGELLTLDSEPFGDALLPKGKALMEIKCIGAIPLWLVHVLSDEKIYKTSFSKYGTAYLKFILPKMQEDKL